MTELQPGDILDGRWEIQGLIGEAPDPAGECDAEHPSAYMTADGSIRCRCIVCPRCHHHTGNSHQGHYWAMCKVLAERLTAELPPGQTLSTAEFFKRTTREFHFCCPDPAFGCSLEVSS